MSGWPLRVGIAGLGIYVPERVLTNFDLEKMVDTSDAWIRERTGIRERRIAAPEESTSDLATRAAQEALQAANLSPEEIDLIIVATASPDMLFPATACLVQANLGASRAAAFDLEAGCSGFIYGLAVGAQFIATGSCRHVLVIGAETLSRLTNWEDRSTCVLFGDGAGAAVLSPVSPPRGLLSFYLRSDGSGGELLKLPAGAARLPASRETVEKKLHFIAMNGREVFKFAVRAMEEAALEALNRAGVSSREIDCFIPHQANIRIIDATAKRLDLPPEKVMVNIDRYGNTSAASIPIALYEAVAQGKIKPGESTVLMVAFGAGLTWGSVLMRY
ncbi:beta-ketoacyl-ACP synthase III [Ammonifex thiophilus]|uniref:Beta-ketoacyl-[acyl-carrier-protein] synthase III n=1 Tax=Ammonifex thiophilus TaxID=444093 RepID=A0A3D8P5N6_9THEO|nr:beta-ketoacyl-ACP synthase III [Ammonifex thiophilus]RDV83613.1 ketoacyl-ACP synthase III [Ammonifex thiophilus]